MTIQGWSLRFHIARFLHIQVNRLAWRFAVPPGPWGRATRIDKTHLLWRLNDWLARRWTGEWYEARVRERR